MPSKVLIAFSITAIFAGYLYLSYEVGSLRNQIITLKSQTPASTITQATPQPQSTLQPNPATAGQISQEDINKLVADAVSQIEIPQSTETIIEREVSSQTLASQVSYIPLASQSATTEKDWADVPGSEVTFNLANDYSASAKATFEASLKVAHANGTAYTRLFDDTHKIAVNGSELSVTDSADFIYKISGALSLWSGTNTYKVQIKSLNGFEVTIDNPRLKISY